MISFNLSYVLKGPTLTIVTLGVRASTHEFGSGGHSLVHYTPYTLKMVPDVSHLTLQIPLPFCPRAPCCGILISVSFLDSQVPGY